jgi:hypothetical protein
MTVPSGEPALLAAADAPPAARLTLGEELAHLAPGWDWWELCRWPPDVFAFTGTVLAESGGYRAVICPPVDRGWPPELVVESGSTWEAAVRGWGAEWAAWATSAQAVNGGAATMPEALVRFASAVDAARDVPVFDLDTEAHWDVAVALLALHAMADEACGGAGRGSDAPLARIASARLAETGSLSRLPTDRVCVLPKLRAPESGITLRSLSRHLALDRSEVEVSWFEAPRPPRAEHASDKLTLLLVPYPATVRASDFRPVEGPLRNMDARRFGFYEFEPQEPFDPTEVLSIVESARRYVGAVDAVVLPESAVEPAMAEELQRQLWRAGVPYLITGVRGRSARAGGFAENYAYFGAMDWAAPPQHKHHRWCIDAAQLEQYHLGAALDPDRRWWEAIEVYRRRLTFVSLTDWLTVCPLVCEDLARPDPVADVVRAVGPTLVVGLLLDGPQLAARWPARYASVLADDPGSSVLTLTALGMAERSQPAGMDPSRVVALWKDPRRGLQQIPLAPDARAVALTAHSTRVEVVTADGRSDKTVSELVLSGLEQIP